MRKLARSASGHRHLRWALEIAATIRAHQKYNYLLSDAQKQALGAELMLLEGYIRSLGGAVAPYRDFLENAYVEVRAQQRVGDFLCDEAQRTAHGHLQPHRRAIDAVLAGGFGAIWTRRPLSRVLTAGRKATVELAERAASTLRSLPSSIPGTVPLAEALERAGTLLRGFVGEAEALEARRLPLRSALQRAVFELREGLDQMDGRLRTHFAPEFIDSLYPELSERGTAVADEDDEDDDTSAPPQG